MHVDVMTIPQPLDNTGELARRAQASGLPGFYTETGRTAYLNADAATQAAFDLETLECVDLWNPNE